MSWRNWEKSLLNLQHPRSEIMYSCLWLVRWNIPTFSLAVNTLCNVVYFEEGEEVDFSIIRKIFFSVFYCDVTILAFFRNLDFLVKPLLRYTFFSTNYYDFDVRFKFKTNKTKWKICFQKEVRDRFRFVVVLGDPSPSSFYPSMSCAWIFIYLLVGFWQKLKNIFHIKRKYNRGRCCSSATYN